MMSLLQLVMDERERVLLVHMHVFVYNLCKFVLNSESAC